MKFDLVIGGVGGQGVLSIAWVLDHAAQAAGLQLKQSEVHGMAQRGGAVSACVRLSDAPIASDLIAQGSADLIVSVEPLEALRYTPLLKPEGWIVTDVTPLINISDYPAQSDLQRVLFQAPRLVACDATLLAKKAGNIKAQNMVVLGAAAALLPLPLEAIEEQVRALFARKGERVVNANLHAFRKGASCAGLALGLREAGIAPVLIAQLCTCIHFPPAPLPDAVVAHWAARLRLSDAADWLQQVQSSDTALHAHAADALGV